MKTYDVAFTPDAQKDMIEHTRYIAQQNQDEHYAIRWYQGMYEMIMGLQKLPNRHPYARENNAFHQIVRQAGYQSHRVIYTIHEDEGKVVIHRVWHTSKDYPKADDLPEIK